MGEVQREHGVFGLRLEADHPEGDGLAVASVRRDGPVACQFPGDGGRGQTDPEKQTGEERCKDKNEFCEPGLHGRHAQLLRQERYLLSCLVGFVFYGFNGECRA
jgi:hypothetical protein